MLSENELLEIAKNFVKQIENESKIETILVKEATIKKEYGNIYFYTSKQFYETKDIQYAVAGGGPFLIENKTGRIIEFGSSHTKEYYIQEYEAGRYPSK